jgi:hypothetical protein
MGKGGKAHKSGGLGKAKLLNSAGSGAGATLHKAKAGTASSTATKVKERARELNAEYGSLRERLIAKNFRKASAPKVVLAAPIFSLPTEQERLLTPLEHPIDRLLAGEGGGGKDGEGKPKPSHPVLNTSTSIAMISLQPSILRQEEEDGL